MGHLVFFLDKGHYFWGVWSFNNGGHWASRYVWMDEWMDGICERKVWKQIFLLRFVGFVLYSQDRYVDIWCCFITLHVCLKMTWSPHPWDSVGIWMDRRLVICRVSQHTRKPLCVLQGTGTCIWLAMFWRYVQLCQSKWTSYFTTICMYSPNLVASLRLLLLWILLDCFRCLFFFVRLVSNSADGPSMFDGHLQKALHEI